MQQRKKKNRTSLFSKIKAWTAVHKTASRTIGVVMLLIVGLAALCIGGSFAGWDVVGFLTSEVFISAIIISAFLFIAVAGYFITKK